MWDEQNFRVLIVTNPNNPTGEVIPKNTLLEYLNWCCKKGIHLVRYVSLFAVARCCVFCQDDIFYKCDWDFILQRGPVCCSDEIYANSVFKRKEDLVSMASILEECAPELKASARALCHVVFGLSKDW